MNTSLPAAQQTPAERISLADFMRALEHYHNLKKGKRIHPYYLLPARESIYHMLTGQGHEYAINWRKSHGPNCDHRLKFFAHNGRAALPQAIDAEAVRHGANPPEDLYVNLSNVVFLFLNEPSVDNFGWYGFAGVPWLDKNGEFMKVNNEEDHAEEDCINYINRLQTNALNYCCENFLRDFEVTLRNKSESSKDDVERKDIFSSLADDVNEIAGKYCGLDAFVQIENYLEAEKERYQRKGDDKRREIYNSASKGFNKMANEDMGGLVFLDAWQAKKRGSANNKPTDTRKHEVSAAVRPLAQEFISIEYLHNHMMSNDPWYGGPRSNVLELLEKLKKNFDGNTIARELFSGFSYGPLRDDKERLLILLWVNVFAVPVYGDREGKTKLHWGPRDYVENWPHFDDCYIRVEDLLNVLNQGGLKIPKAITDMQGGKNLALWNQQQKEKSVLIETLDADTSKADSAGQDVPATPLEAGGAGLNNDMKASGKAAKKKKNKPQEREECLEKWLKEQEQFDQGFDRWNIRKTRRQVWEELEELYPNLFDPQDFDKYDVPPTMDKFFTTQKRCGFELGRR